MTRDKLFLWALCSKCSVVSFDSFFYCSAMVSMNKIHKINKKLPRGGETPIRDSLPLSSLFLVMQQNMRHIKQSGKGATFCGIELTLAFLNSWIFPIDQFSNADRFLYTHRIQKCTECYKTNIRTLEVHN